MLLMFKLTNFSPPVKLFLLVPNEEDPVLFSFVGGSNLFWFSKFNCSSKKESEKLKKSHFGKIQVQFVFSKVSYWDSVMKEHPFWTYISQLSHWTALWSFRRAPLHNTQSVWKREIEKDCLFLTLFLFVCVSLSIHVYVLVKLYFFRYTKHTPVFFHYTKHVHACMHIVHIRRYQN